MVGERNKFVLRGVSDGQKEGKGRDEGVEMTPSTFSCPLRPSVHSNSKSDVSGWINDRELVTLIRSPLLSNGLLH